jgi:hypothetical protein
MLEYVPASFVVIRHVRHQAELHEVRLHRAGGSAESTDRARPGGAGTAGACAGVVSTAIIFRCIGNRRSTRVKDVELERSTLAGGVT